VDTTFESVLTQDNSRRVIVAVLKVVGIFASGRVNLGNITYMYNIGVVSF
jgi:hypothetical protein